MQKTAVQTIQKNDQGDPLGEGETLTHLNDFMTQKTLHPESRTKLIRALENWERSVVAVRSLTVAPEEVAIRAVAEVDLEER